MTIRSFNDTNLSFLPTKGKQLKQALGRGLALSPEDKWLVLKVSIALPLVEGGLRLLGYAHQELPDPAAKQAALSRSNALDVA